MSPKERLNSAAQAVSPSREHTPFASDSQTESILEPELTDFCSRLHITPAIMEFISKSTNLFLYFQRFSSLFCWHASSQARASQEVLAGERK
jgi:hypothetical protein